MPKAYAPEEATQILTNAEAHAALLARAFATGKVLVTIEAPTAADGGRCKSLEIEITLDQLETYPHLYLGIGIQALRAELAKGKVS